jgi:uncharacterized protein
MKLLVALVVLTLASLLSRSASAYVPPVPRGAITDTSGKLTESDDAALEAHVAAYRARTTTELAVLMVGSLGGENIDDVAFATFKAWGVGKRGTDNGVLLVIAPTERKMRIETGKGVGDRLTDLESSHILRDKVGPLLKQDRFREAVLAGLTAIEAALDAGGPIVPVAPGNAAAAPAPPKRSLVTLLLPLVVLGLCAIVMLGGLYLIVRAVYRRSNIGSSGPYSGRSYTSSSGDSDWSSGGSSGGGSDWSSGGSSSGGGDFGGGSSGGGGSSDSY